MTRELDGLQGQSDSNISGLVRVNTVMDLACQQVQWPAHLSWEAHALPPGPEPLYFLIRYL